MKKHVQNISILLFLSLYISFYTTGQRLNEKGFKIIGSITEKIIHDDDEVFKKGIAELNQYLKPKYLGNTTTLIGVEMVEPFNGYYFDLIYDLTHRDEKVYERLLALGLENEPCTGLFKRKYKNNYSSYQMPLEDYGVYQSDYMSIKLNSKSARTSDVKSKAKTSDGLFNLEETWKDGKRNGLCKGWHPNGNPSFECNYKDGIKHGLVKNWYDDGILMSESNYIEGKRDGISRDWYHNEQLHNEGTWKDGKEADGVFKCWYENGKTMYEYTYKEGKIVGKKMWDNNGKLTVDQ
jgi:antitoxin component YwqK of YwqJK toxin-antitoxin module